MTEPIREIVCQYRECPNWPGEDEFCKAFEETGWDWSNALVVDDRGMYSLMCAWSGTRRRDTND